MVFHGPSYQVAPGIAPCAHLTDDPETGKYLQGTVYGDQSDFGVFLFYPLVYLGRAEVAPAAGNRFQDCPSPGG